MANRYQNNYIVSEGKYKGYRKEDADDAYWSVGYTLPKLPDYQGWRMRTFCIKSVSDNNINIEVLPTYLRTLVNHYHAEYGVGRVTNINAFNVKCSNHQDKAKKRCRQCRARRDTVRLVLMTELKMEITHGLLVRAGWEPPKEKKDKRTAKEEATVTTKGQSEKSMIKSEPGEQAQDRGRDRQVQQEVRKEQTKGERIKVLTAHETRAQTICGRDPEIEGNSQSKNTQETQTMELREKPMGVTTKEWRVIGTITKEEVTTSPSIGKIKLTRRDLSPCQRKGNFPCEGCGKEYRYKRNLMRHVKDQHEITETDSSEESEGQAIICSNSSLMGNRKVLKCVRLSENARIPTRGTYRSVGHDLYSAYEYTIRAGGQALVKTDLQIAMPPGCYGRIASRSSLAHFHGIDVGAGVIDPDYRGNVGAVLFNLGSQDYVVKKGDRCAQIILEQAYVPFVVEVESLGETSRGTGSFGSTGRGEKNDH